MKRSCAIAVAVLLFGMPVEAAERSMTLAAQTKIVDGGRVWREQRQYSYSFRIEVIADRGGRKEEGTRDGRPFITAEPGEEYRVRIHNPLPVRVAANLSIDGLNSLTGRPGTPEGGRKWVIEPESWVDIVGWQVSQGSARRFVFTSRGDSYASWRSNDWGRDLAVNCGVIGVAYFWSQRELDEYFERNPIVVRRRGERWDEKGDRADGARMAPRSSSMQDERAPEEQQRAGTGMGERESNPTREVQMRYDQGMYRAQDAVVITYDFAEERRRGPQPFEDRGYAPEWNRGRVSPRERRHREPYVFDNGNIARVFNNPRQPTWITLEEPTHIVKIANYHWNHGRGATPGTIGLERQDGRAFGPWRASGSPGQGGVPNAYWTVFPETTIPAGTYRVIDSNPGTWSFNRESGDSGFSRVEGR